MIQVLLLESPSWGMGFFQRDTLPEVDTVSQAICVGIAIAAIPTVAATF
ncbi:MAG: hypothetical protein AAF892_16910 [Cyanobacteria bacterium P01_D01_bin.71]